MSKQDSNDRRRFPKIRFSLRSLLLLTLILGVVVARETYLFRAQQFCANEIRKIDMPVLHYRFPWLQSRVPRLQTARFESLLYRVGAFDISRMDDEQDTALITRILDALASLNSARYARVSLTQWTDARIESLRSMSRLETLSLSGSSCDDRVIEAVATLEQLKGLALVRVSMSDDAAMELVALKKLRWLVLENVSLSDETVSQLRHALPNTYVSYLRPTQQR